ncbi:MAG: RNA polymerase factor sigma-54 [Desulforhopalus sp.]|nr:RNA polymerase factor sigma-54 [Desulforhopalus sp.]
MALELRQQLKLQQKLVMTQQLRQAIQLLQLNRTELSDALQAELEQNPGLEEDVSVLEPENTAALSSTREDTGPAQESEVTEKLNATEGTIPETNWEEYENSFDSNLSFSRETPPADAPSQFDFISEEPGLSAHLAWQLAHQDLDEKEKEIAMFIIGNLNRYGFLEVELDEIIADCNCQPDEAEYVLCDVIQLLDPPGIAARNVSESLYLQLEQMGKSDTLAAEIVRDHLPLLETRNYKELSRQTGRKKPEIERAIDFIVEELTPWPGLPWNNDSTNYIVPDVYVQKVDGEYLVHLNEDDLPRLKLSTDLQEMLKEGRNIDKDKRHYLHDKLKDANWFIKSLYQRQQTIYRVMNSILNFQQDFFEKGPEHLKPLILKDVAQDIDVHESTVSRVTSNKYVHCSQGIFELKYFFSTAIQKEDGSTMAAESIKTIIRRIVSEEDKKTPLSDSAITSRLAESDIKIARRTVAKYREQLKIPPVKHRRER